MSSSQVIQQVGAAAYQQARVRPPAQPGGAGPRTRQGPAPDGEDVVDGEFRNVQ